MKKIELSDVKNIYDYETVRPALRQRIIALKRRRRLRVSPHLSLLFENRETVLFQIQEMCRAERIVEEARIQEEIDAYNDLIPGEGELSATLFIEVEDSSRIKEVLDRYLGIDVGEHLWIQIGKEHAILGQFQAGHSDQARGKISAVHFVTFSFTPERIQAFRNADAYLLVDHPAERTRVRLPDEVKAALLEDFTP